MSVNLFSSPDYYKKLVTFDSGIGGYEMTNALYHILPQLHHICPYEIIHIADIKNLPYGNKSVVEIIGYVTQIASYALGQGADKFIICCNTASVHADKIIHNLLNQGFTDADKKIISLKNFTYHALQEICDPVIALQKDIHLLFLATRATVTSRNYVNFLFSHYNALPCDFIQAETSTYHLCETLKTSLPNGITLSITQFAPLSWVSLIENNTTTALIAQRIIQDLEILKSFMSVPLTAVGLFCTHYPLVKHHIDFALRSHNIINKESIFLSQTQSVTHAIIDYLSCDIYTEKSAILPHIFTTSENITHLQKLHSTLFPTSIVPNITYLNM